jgi:glycosyltransferase involved in cell wall biosynthesis
MSVSVVMPCYNEEEVIEKTVRSFYNEISSRIDDVEFIVVDDHSSDNTPAILENLRGQLPKLKIIRNKVNSGHGRTVRQAYDSAQKEWIFQVDSDGQFDAKDFHRLYMRKDDHDFVLGFRERRDDPFTRLLLTKLIRIVNFILFGVWLKDANCPFRLIKGSVLREILQGVDRDAVAPNIMISIMAKKKNINMLEVPVRHYRRSAKTSAVRNMKLIRIAFRGFRELVLFKNRP